jgi:arginine decarboxylase
MGDELLGKEASCDLDWTQVLMDVSATGTSGYQAVDWLRENCQIDLGLGDHRRMLATISIADDKHTADRLVEAMTAWRNAVPDFERPSRIDLPSPDALQLETVQLPRDAFFGPTEMVPAERGAGRIAAEQITPYPPGIPAVVPGERLNDAVIDYLRSGVQAGMTLPDPSDPTVAEFRVVA